MAAADTHIVDADHSDIQAVINTTGPGDTIEIYWISDGYYSGQSGIFIDKPLTIVGINSDAGLPRIYIGYEGITVEADDVTIDGLILASIEGNPRYGINIVGSSGVDILNVQIPGYYNNYIGEIVDSGIMVESSDDILIEGCEIGGYLDTEGACTYDTGINITNSDNVIVNDSYFSGCLQYGLDMTDSQQVTVTWCEVYNTEGYNVRVSGDCSGSVLYRNMFSNHGYGYNVYYDGTGVKWNSTAPISYTYDDAGFTWYNGNYWYYYSESNMYYGFDDDRNGVGDTMLSVTDGVIDYYPLVTVSRQHKYVYFLAPSEVIYEGDTDVPVIIRLSGDVSGYTSVMIESPQGTAAYGSDYLARPSLSQGPYQGAWISFDPEQTSNIVYIDTIADDQIEDDRWINLSLVTGNPSPPPELIINRSLFNLTILDTSEYPSVSIETQNTTADEGGPVVPVTVVRSGAANGSVDVSFSLSGTAARGVDYAYEPASLHFARGEREKTINFTLSSDSADENAETIIVSLTDVTDATLGTRAVCEITMRDTTQDVTPTPEPTEQPGPTPTPSPTPTPTPVPQPALPSIAFLSAEGTGDEGASAYIVIVRSDNLTVPCDVTFNIAGGTAVNGVDYSISPAPGAIHFAAGDTTAALRVRIFEDAVTEEQSTAIFSLSGANGTSIGSISTYALRIRDTTEEPVITFYEPGAYADAGTDVTVVIRRVGPRNGSADVILTVQDGTAVYGKDFSCSPAPGRIQFGPGESVKTITVSISGDSAAEGNLGARFVLSDPHGAGIGNMSTFALYIGDEASAIPDNVTTVMVRIPMSEIIPGTVFSFPAIVVAVLTGYMMVRIGGRRREGPR